MDEQQAIARADELGAWIGGHQERVDAARPELLTLLLNAVSTEALVAAIFALAGGGH